VIRRLLCLLFKHQYVTGYETHKSRWFVCTRCKKILKEGR